MKEINHNLIELNAKNWKESAPFPHFVIDNFFDEDFAKVLEKEFPDFNDGCWDGYGNAIEIKKLCNKWNSFPKNTYNVFQYLNSPEFTSFLSEILFGERILSSDSGLNGGGWHIHSSGGKLNTHLDYSVHPKLGLQRKLNIIIYLNSAWQDEWGGQLGLWGNQSDKEPGELIKEVKCRFNRAVIFDTTCNSWHGLPDPIQSPEDQFRKSLAVYYLCDAPDGINTRGKALFAPTENQKNDKSVLELIEKRSKISSASNVYNVK